MSPKQYLMVVLMLINVFFFLVTFSLFSLFAAGMCGASLILGVGRET